MAEECPHSNCYVFDHPNTEVYEDYDVNICHDCGMMIITRKIAKVEE